MSRKKQSQIISYLRKNKLIVLIFLVSFFSLASYGMQVSAVDLKYTPNVKIPIKIGTGAGEIDFAGENTISDGTFLAKYIVAIYTFGAGFAGIVAMLMLVIAGWKWLMAGGNAQKIIEAKGTITGALLGLAILFGGQLLLRQISENFASIQSLDLDHVERREGEGKKEDCIEKSMALSCGNIETLVTTERGDYYCLGIICPYEKECVYSNTEDVPGYEHEAGDTCDMFQAPQGGSSILNPEEYFKCRCRGERAQFEGGY